MVSLEMIVIVFGISGVGKTSLIAQHVARDSGCVHISGSTVIEGILSSSDKQGTVRRDKDKRTLLKLQELAVREIHRESQSYGNKLVILDAHNVIDAADGLVRIPVSVFESLSPILLLFVYDDPKEIKMRRLEDTSRRRPNIRTSELACYQDIAFDTARSYSSALGIDLAQVRSGDLVAFQTVIDSSRRIAGASNGFSS